MGAIIGRPRRATGPPEDVLPHQRSTENKNARGLHPSGLPDSDSNGKPQGGAIPVAWVEFQPHIASVILAHSNPRAARRFDE